MAGIFEDLQHLAVVSAGNTYGTAISATGAQTTVDMKDCGANRITALANVSAIGSSGIVTIKIQESDTTTDGDFADITGATFGSSFATVNTEQIKSFNITKRYVRAHATLVSGTSVTMAIIFLAQRKTTPVSNGGWVNDTY